MSNKPDKLMEAKKLVIAQYEAEVASAKALIDKKYESLFAAFDAHLMVGIQDVPVLPAVVSTSSAPEQQISHEARQDRRRRPDGPSATVRQAIQAVFEEQGDFTMPEVYDWIFKNVPEQQIERTAVSNVLHKLKERDEIHILVPGAGNKPAVWGVGKHPAGEQNAMEANAALTSPADMI